MQTKQLLAGCGRMIKIRNKKGQFKVQQMAFMLIAVIIFFALVAIFVLAFQFSSMKEKATVLQEENALLLVAKLADSPEFSCGNSFGETRANCIDFDKVMILKQEISKYKNFWGVSNIEIRKIYDFGREKTCTSSNYPDCNTLKLIESTSSGYDYSNFVSLCWKEQKKTGTGQMLYDKCEIGKITVRYREKI